jgi:putative Mg2+ transporter-C (MgtC) family protein
MTTSLFDDLLRLGLATVIGGLIGLNRELHGKPAGLRTNALVALGSALIVITTGQLPGTVDFHASDAQSRAIQGLITGIGFLGAGVILRKTGEDRVTGLTTAAAVWVAALFGAACGGGVLEPVLVAFVLLATVLVFGGRIEKRIHRLLRPHDDQTETPTE